MASSTELVFNDSIYKNAESLSADAASTVRIHADAYDRQSVNSAWRTDRSGDRNAGIPLTNLTIEDYNVRGGTAFDYRGPNGQIYDFRRYLGFSSESTIDATGNCCGFSKPHMNALAKGFSTDYYGRQLDGYADARFGLSGRNGLNTTDCNGGYREGHDSFNGQGSYGRAGMFNPLGSLFSPFGGRGLGGGFGKVIPFLLGGMLLRRLFRR